MTEKQNIRARAALKAVGPIVDDMDAIDAAIALWAAGCVLTTRAGCTSAQSREQLVKAVASCPVDAVERGIFPRRKPPGWFRRWFLGVER